VENETFKKNVSVTVNTDAGVLRSPNTISVLCQLAARPQYIAGAAFAHMLIWRYGPKEQPASGCCNHGEL